VRYVVDSTAILRLLADEASVLPGNRLVAPTLLRSEVNSLLYEAVRAGELEEPTAKQRIRRFDTLKIRYLGDKVLRAVAWRVASELGSEDTYAAEYIALTQLQADALVTLDKTLERAAKRFVETAPYAALIS
jgi:predicted nucleic acid-binding protein